jgi:hypothetical protein
MPFQTLQGESPRKLETPADAHWPSAPARADLAASPAEEVKSTREMIYEAERAKAARWARTLIWGSGGAWALAIPTAIRLWWPEVTGVEFDDPSASLLVIGGFLAATVVVFYLLVNQRELVRRKAHAAGLAALDQLDQRERVVSAVGASVHDGTGES